VFSATAAMPNSSRARPISAMDSPTCGIGSAAKAAKRSRWRSASSAYWSLTNLAAPAAFCPSSPYGVCGQADSTPGTAVRLSLASRRGCTVICMSGAHANQAAMSAMCRSMPSG
jgi:hypothetical protein